MLDEEAFERAVQFIDRKARDLDQTLYRIEFEDGDPMKLLDALKPYQNEDGGFGHGIEPDIQLEESSILSTTVACQYLNQIDVKIPQEFAQPLVNYFSQSVRWSGNMPYWISVPSSINDIPHPFWWTVEEEAPPLPDNWINPSVEVIGYLSQYGELVDRNLNENLRDYMRKYLLKFPPKELDYFNYLCWKRSLPHVPEDIQQNIFKRIDSLFLDKVALNIEKLSIVHPHSIITEKTSHLYTRYPKKILNLLSHEVEEQADDGGWHPGWRWESSEWERIEQEWSGKLSVELLITLKYCDFLANY